MSLEEIAKKLESHEALQREIQAEKNTCLQKIHALQEKEKRAMENLDAYGKRVQDEFNAFREKQLQNIQTLKLEQIKTQAVLDFLTSLHID